MAVDWAMFGRWLRARGTAKAPSGPLEPLDRLTWAREAEREVSKAYSGAGGDEPDWPGAGCLHTCPMAPYAEERPVEDTGSDALWLTGPQRVRAALRREGLATTGGDSPQWRLPEDAITIPWPGQLPPTADQVVGRLTRSIPVEADDTVLVERLAHWLHGEFGGLFDWHRSEEYVRESYRRTARALMSQLPELFW